MKELLDLYEEVNKENLEENSQDNSSDDENIGIIENNGAKLKKNIDGEYWYEDSDEEEDN